MNITSIGKNVAIAITTLACVAAGVKSYERHTERVVKNIKYELKHNQKDSIFWVRNCGADRYVSEQNLIQKQIDINAKNEPLINKIAFWEHVAKNIEREHSIRKQSFLDRSYLKKQMDAGLRQVYRHVRLSGGYKGVNMIQEHKWVSKEEAEKLVSKGDWHIENSFLLKY